MITSDEVRQLHGLPVEKRDAMRALAASLRLAEKLGPAVEIPALLGVADRLGLSLLVQREPPELEVLLDGRVHLAFSGPAAEMQLAQAAEANDVVRDRAGQPFGEHRLLRAMATYGVIMTADELLGEAPDGDR